jgi:Zn-dependent alcohol dehydrogenase
MALTSPLALTGVIDLCALVGGVIGFVVAMRTHLSFNRRVRQSMLYQPLKLSRMIRTSLKLDTINEAYEEMPAFSKE